MAKPYQHDGLSWERPVVSIGGNEGRQLLIERRVDVSGVWLTVLSANREDCAGLFLMSGQLPSVIVALASQVGDHEVFGPMLEALFAQHVSMVRKDADYFVKRDEWTQRYLGIDQGR